MGLFDKFKKKRETLESSSKVKHAVEEESVKKEKKAKEKKAKVEKGSGSLTKDEIRAAQSMEGGAASQREKPSDGKDGKKEEKAKKEEKHVPRDTKSAYKYLIKPIVTEKSSFGASMNTYAFQVIRNATKAEIAKAVAVLYNVKPVSVRIVNVKGKKIRFGKTEGSMKDKKKAYITLTKGQTIDVTQ